jgi:hypothetical protein
MLSRAPSSAIEASATATCAARLGSIRHAGSSAGRAVTVMLPRMSTRWSIVFSVSPCTPCFRLPPSRPPNAPVMLPASLASWPVARNVPVSAVDTVSASTRPATASGPRAMVQPISALERSCVSGLSRLPARSRGAARSMASRSAPWVIATGVTITEVRVSGGSGGTAVNTGRRSEVDEPTRLIAQSAPRNEPTTTNPPTAILAHGRCREDGRIGIDPC